MLPLTGSEAAGYLSDQFLDDRERRRWQPITARLRDDPDGLLAGQLATPWRLTLAVTVFRDSGDPAELLPLIPGPGSVALAAYPLRVDRLLLSRYVPAAVRLHDPDERYSPEQVQHWLTAIAEGLAWQADHGRSATDLQLDQWWRVIGQRATALAHVALVAVAAIPWLAAGVILGSGGITFTGGSLLLVAATAGSAPAPKRFTLRTLTTRRGLTQLAVGLAAGLAIGPVAGLAAGLAIGLAAELARPSNAARFRLSGRMTSSARTVGSGSRSGSCSRSRPRPRPSSSSGTRTGSPWEAWPGSWSASRSGEDSDRIRSPVPIESDR
jgi:hypothetical protein